MESPAYSLNAICPYFTMFPLEFPLQVLSKYGSENENVLDPFCGRGTTNFAARILGMRSFGLDNSPVAAAISKSKLIHCSPSAIVEKAVEILSSSISYDIPEGEFWERAYHKTTLRKLCKLRASLIRNCSTPERIALRGIVLGALHGPVGKISHSYFSNQCTRTYAPKPRYALKFWSRNRLFPPKVNFTRIIQDRAHRYYSNRLPSVTSEVLLKDSRKPASFDFLGKRRKYHWVITSPPYYGMTTYIPDQWLRNWFLGGEDSVVYTSKGQLAHKSPEEFAEQLQTVWKNALNHCTDISRLVIRFGGISDRKASPLEIIKASLKATDWKIQTVKNAGNAKLGKRQADFFLKNHSLPITEYDVWATIN